MNEIIKLGNVIIWGIIFYIFSTILIYIGLNATYKDIDYKGILPSQISISLSQASSVTGRIYGEVTSIEDNDLNGKFIKVQIYDKKGNVSGIKFLEIKDIKINEPKKFVINFKAERIESYTVDIVENSEEVKEQIKKVSDLYKDVFTEEEIKTYTVITLALFLMFT